MTARRADRLGYLGLPPGSSEDKALALAFKAGEKGAYQAIYDRYERRVRHLCLRMLGSHEDAAEACQETFLRVYQGLFRFNGRYQLGPWITRIATNVCLDMLRARSRRPKTAAPIEDVAGELPGPADVMDPGELVVRQAEGSKVRAALDRLPIRHRTAILLRDELGHSYAEVAKAMNMTEPQVKALLHRARGSFKRSWRGLASVFLPLQRAAQRLRAELIDGPAERAAHLANATAPALTPLSERLATAAVAVVVAGSVGAAGVVAKDSRRAQAHPAPSAPAAVAAPADEVRAGAARARALKAELGKGRQARAEKGPGAAQVPTDARALPSPQPGSEAQPSPAPEPSPTPEPQPTPSAPASPGWSMAFSAALSTANDCGCGGSAELVDSRTTGTPGARVTYYQRIVGFASDAEGDAAWGLGLEYAGEVAGSRGDLAGGFVLTINGSSYYYNHSGYLVERHQMPEGGYAYTFRGSYALYKQTGPDGLAPKDSTFTARLIFWPDGTLYRTEFRLD